MKVYQVLDENFNGVATFDTIFEASNFMFENGFIDTGRHNMIEGIRSVWNAGNDSAYIVRYLLDEVAY